MLAGGIVILPDQNTEIIIGAMSQSDLASWPADLQIVFAAIGRAMGAGRLHPQILTAVPSACGAVLTSHVVEIAHKRKAEIGQSRGLYVITITGDRWRASRWALRSGDLEKLAREACLTSKTGDSHET